jgi:uncharacterized membrane protein
MSRRAQIGAATKRVADYLNPITSEPAAPLTTAAFLNAFGPSLMPRASFHQGIAAGLSVLAGRVVGTAADALARRIAPGTSPLAWRLGARAGIAAVGSAVAMIPEHDDESTAVASLRSAGRLARAGAIGGMFYEAGNELRERYPAKGPLRPTLVGLGGFGLALVESGRMLDVRKGLIKRWTDDDKPAALPASFAIGWGVSAAGRGIGKGFLASRSSLVRFFGEDAAHAAIGRTVNVGIWAAGAAGLYFGVVSFISRSNEKIEPAYSTPPDNEYVSAGTKSKSPFEDLGLQGRRYVTDVVTPDLIESTLDEPAVGHPIRVYVGFNSEPLYATGRSEWALDEMDRLGAWDRSYLLLFSPTGTGWVDQTLIESVELMTRGDVATVCIQYGRGPSFLEVQNVGVGRSQFRQLLWGVKQRLSGMPPEQRPKVLVFGESLGAWSSSDVVMHRGISGFDDYGIDRALWFGLPGLAKWSKTGMRSGSSDLVPPGTVSAFDHFDQYDTLDAEERDKLRAVIVDHDNDPIAQMSFRSAVKQPPWLDDEDRGRNVPESMGWIPLITFIQVLIDAMNAMRTVPGQFKSFGHDYRGDTADFAHAAFQLPPVTEAQREAVEEALLRLEVERGERIKQSKEAAAKQEAAEKGVPKRARRRTWLRDRTEADMDEPAAEQTPGEAPGDIQ